MNAVAPILAEASDVPAERFAAVAARLEAPRQAIDGAFLSVGGRLAECATILARITKTFEALPADLESAELEEATDRLSLVGCHAREIAAALAAEQDDLRRLAQVLASAGHPIHQLRRAVKMMGIVAVNARAVAAGIAEQKDDFDVFTTDIAKLADSATTTIAQFSRTYGRLSDAVETAVVTRDEFEAAHRNTLTALADALAAGINDMTAYRRRAVDASADTGRMSRAIADGVATAVMALQVGDATRQRVEHVESALRDPATSDASLSSLVAELQRRQLVSAREVLIAEMASGEAALGQLVADTRAVVAHARKVYGDDDGSSALGALNAALRQAVAILADCEAERQKLDKVAATVAETVKVLLHHVQAVQEIEGKMRLVSLNAAIKCAQLGPRGSALNVISQQLRALTGETVVSANDAVARLNEGVTIASAFTSVAGVSAGRVSDLEHEAAGALALLESVAQRMRSALRALQADAPVVGQRLNEAMSDLSQHGAISEALCDIEFDLADLVPADGATRDALVQAPEAITLLADLRRRYTMDVERRVHDDYASIRPADTIAPPNDSIDDLLF